jgi:hypothetical protein
MTHRRLEFVMPAESAVVFDCFHYHHWRKRWDSLVSATHVLGGAPCPYVGATTSNTGAGWLRGLAMQTQFISYRRPQVAAARMVGSTFPFSRWAASMRHVPDGDQQSILIYTYSFDTAPGGLRWVMRPVVNAIFLFQTRRRFERMRQFLFRHAPEIRLWGIQRLPDHMMDLHTWQK